MRPPALLLTAIVLAVAGCGSDDSSSDQEGSGSSSSQQGGGSSRAAVEKAARDSIVENQADEDDTEQADAISIEQVQVNGDDADVVAKSSLTGNRYKLTMNKAGGGWERSTIFTDRPSETPSSGGDPSKGSGPTLRIDQIEAGIERQLLKPLRIGGQAKCPSGVKARRGNNFQCEVVGAKGKTTVTVTQKDDQGHLKYNVTSKR